MVEVETLTDFRYRIRGIVIHRQFVTNSPADIVYVINSNYVEIQVEFGFVRYQILTKAQFRIRFRNYFRNGYAMIE